MNGRKARILNLPLAGSLSANRRTKPFLLMPRLVGHPGPASDGFANIGAI